MLFGKEEFVPSKKITKKRRKEAAKPWGKKERYLVLYVITTTLIFSAILAASARSWKLPGVPRLQIPKLTLFSSQKIIIEGNNMTNNSHSQKSEKTINEFNTATKNLSGVYGLYVYDLDSGTSFGINEKEVFEAASLIKLPIMSAAFKENTETQLIEAMGKRSDNNAQKKVVETIGIKKIEEEIAKIGMVDTNYQNNNTTPHDIGLFFKKLWDGEILENDKKEKMYEFLTNTIYENHLAAGVPGNIRVIHKYARERHVVNDAGIIVAPKPFIVVIMSKGVVENEADKAFPNLSKIVYNSWIQEAQLDLITK